MQYSIAKELGFFFAKRESCVYFFQGSEYRFKNSSGPRTEILRPVVSLADSCGATRHHPVCASTKSREVPVSHVGVTLSLWLSAVRDEQH